jgi:hypothetical protein
MGTLTFDYAGVAPERFAAWQDVLRDARSADALWPYLESVPRLVDAAHPHVQAYLASARSFVEPPPRARKSRDRDRDLVHAVDTFEVLLLGLIGPEGQSPHAPRSLELPNQPYFEAWMALAFDHPNLLPGPDAVQVVGRRQPRAWLGPAQVRALAEARPRGIVDVEACRARTAGRFLVALDVAERARYERWEARFREVAEQLHADLKAFAARGAAYVGWMTWTGDE